MKQLDKNKLFDFFNEKHDVLLTEDEIDEIIEKVSKYDDGHYLSLIQNKINMYRAINIVLLVVLNFVFSSKSMNYIFWIFISYNFVHLFINVFKNIRDARRKHRMARKR